MKATGRQVSCLSFYLIQNASILFGSREIQRPRRTEITRLVTGVVDTDRYVATACALSGVVYHFVTMTLSELH